MEERQYRNDGKIIERDIEKEMKTAYIDYAMSVIVSRALPDARDGLKPVHRRILYAMHEDGITSDKPYRKCANTVGSVLGRYHPHGDASVYDAMVRMAQDFSMRYMLIDGHGNFGSIDGDGAAAMRYTEARMSKIAEQMLVDIEKNTVDFMPNYDDRLQEPTVLPAKIPALLVNGSSGIAVGMATNIPPHNLTEVINGIIKIIDDDNVTDDELIQIIKGPDFPTGGLILGLEGIKEAYKTGRGKIIMRAEAEIEEMSGNRQRIIVSSLPYQVNKARLIENIARLAREVGCGDFVKIEVIHDSKYLLPDNYETIKATEILAKEGFVVMPYMYPDLNAARDLVNAGAAAVMPLGSPIGSNKGICTKDFIQILIDEIDLPIIVDAGIGKPSQACEAMEMGAAAVMANTAIATAGDIPAMAEAFKKAIEAGRSAYLAGLGRVIEKGSSASSPLTGFLED